MHFQPTPLWGVFVIDTQRLEDDRGFFARTFADAEFEQQGLRTTFPQCSISYNRKKGTLRGMHLQIAPHEEAKIVRCTAGAVFDVALDLRRDSPSFRQWFGVELSAENRRMVYIPEGVAHGYQTLADDSEVFYQISVAYEPASQRGVRWDDATFGIAWPLDAARLVSARDRSFPDFIV
jgi:dTDP-4-dehydrorhamnose 3,5-epimerase